jgi:hypothetical protein
MVTLIFVKINGTWHYSHDVKGTVKIGDIITAPNYYTGRLVKIKHNPEVAYIEE